MSHRQSTILEGRHHACNIQCCMTIALHSFPCHSRSKNLRFLNYFIENHKLIAHIFANEDARQLPQISHVVSLKDLSLI
jgi:hypothetical protein